MTREEKLKAIDALKISAPVKAVTQEEFNDYIQTLNKVMDWLEQEPCEDAVVSRQKVAEVLLKYAHSTEGKVFAEFLVSQINALPPVTPKQRWIPVSERLPEEHTCDDGFIEPSKAVLVQMKSGCMKVSRYWGSRKGYKDCPWIDLSYPTTDEVIYWQPLPEKYKEGESE